MQDKINLKDVTFLILIRIDSIERLENILATTSCLSLNFDTNINVLECTSYDNGILKKLLPDSVNYIFQEDYDPILYRTRYLNQMLQTVQTAWVSIWDADVIAPLKQIVDAVKLLRDNEADFVYPYEKRFLDTSDILRELYLKLQKIEFLERYEKKMKMMYPPKPVGGAFLCGTQVYKEAGMENENFYGWGVEDGERYCRWEKLGYRIKRVEGPLFHLSHPRGINSLIHQADQSFLKMKLLKESARLTKGEK